MAHRFLTDTLLGYLARDQARRNLKQFERAADQAVRTQLNVLRAILSCNEDSDFGQQHGFKHVSNYKEFAERVPIQTYEDLRPFVDRALAGDHGALIGSGRRALMFATTSGSTDAPKHIPVTEEFVREYRRGWQAFGAKALRDHPDAFLRPIVQVVSSMDDDRTTDGVPCGSVSGMLAASQKGIVRKFYTTPVESAKISDPDARYYTIMRMAIPRDVGWMVTANPATHIRLARTGVTHAERIIRDVRDGTLTPPGDVEATVHRAIVNRLKPDRKVAAKLEALLREHSELLPRHYWNLSFIANWTGGTMGLHLCEFPKYFGQVPVRDIGLLATEGRVTVPLDDQTPVGVLDCDGAFFEFVETDSGDDKTAAVRLCHELEVGRTYRVVMTTWAGLYRYDLGDYVRVHGYLGQAPKLEFLHRGAHVSSITGEKITEWQVTAAFGACRDEAPQVSNKFILAPHFADPPFYRLHVEVDTSEQVARLAAAFDEELSRLNIEYLSKRKSGRLGPVVCNRLPSGFLDRLNASLVAKRGASNEQFKHQYLLTQPGDDKEMPLEHQASPVFPAT